MTNNAANANMTKGDGELPTLVPVDGKINDKLLTAEEECELARLAAEGNRDAEEKLVYSNQRLVAMIAFRYVGVCKALDFDDLKQAGNIGLMQAVKLFDPSKGFRFSTYAIWWIRQSITREIADKDKTIRIPVHISDRLSKIRRLSSEIEQQTGRQATVEEIAAAMDMPPEKVEELWYSSLSATTVSLDKPIGEEGENTLEDFLIDERNSPQDESDADQLRQSIEQVLAMLSPREQVVIKLRYGLTDGMPHTLEDVGATYGVTRERVRQIEIKALRKLRSPKIGKLLGDFRY